MLADSEQVETCKALGLSMFFFASHQRIHQTYTKTLKTSLHPVVGNHLPLIFDVPGAAVVGQGIFHEEMFQKPWERLRTTAAAKKGITVQV